MSPRAASARRPMSLARPKPDPEAIAKAAIGRRAVAGKARVALTLRAATAQTLAARAIREEKNLEQLLVEILERAAAR